MQISILNPLIWPEQIDLLSTLTKWNCETTDHEISLSLSLLSIIKLPISISITNEICTKWGSVLSEVGREVDRIIKQNEIKILIQQQTAPNYVISTKKKLSL